MKLYGHDLANRLRINADGELFMADGSDVKAYLAQWVAKTGITPDTPMNLVERKGLMNMGIGGCLRCLTGDERFALAA